MVTANQVLGRIDWSMERSKESHRTYKIKWLVRTPIVNVGPLSVYSTPGIPAVGTQWAYGGDSDPWAFCWPEATVTPQSNSAEPGRLWIIEQKFSTEPLKRCQDSQIDDPLLEPINLSGSFVKYVQECHQDRNGRLIATSAGERFTGSVSEKDESRPTVQMQFNSSANQLETFGPMMDHVNDRTLWTFPKRTIKLCAGSWTRKLYGVCHFYYTTNLEFNVYLNKQDDGTLLGYDHRVLDFGKNALLKSLLYDVENGGAPITSTNAQKDLWRKDPRNIEPWKGANSENSAGTQLDLHGAPWVQASDDDKPPSHLFEKYNEANFLLLHPLFPTTL